MGHSVSYKEGAWNDMGDAINRMSAWRSGIFDRMRAMDQVFRNLHDTVDDLDEDHRIHFSYKSMSGSLDKLNDDYQKLYNFTSDAGEAVSRHIDHPFFTKMDAFVEAMEKISIDKITTKNTLNVKELQSTSQLASVATYEQVKKKEITLDDIFSNDRLMKTSLKSEYETFKAMATSKKAEKVTFDQYKEAIQYSRGFNYKSIRDKQIDKEFWVNLGIGTAIVILTIACPPAGAVASITYGAMQMTDAVTGTSMISGRKLSTEERITEGAFGLLDLAPGAAALRGAGAFGALGRTGTKSMTKIGDLTKAMGQASSRRLMDLRRAGTSGLNKVRNVAAEQVKQVNQSAADMVDRMSLGGMQPAMAGGYGTVGGRISDQLKNTFQQITSKERVNHEIVYNKTEKVQGVEKVSGTSSKIEIGKEDIDALREKLNVPETHTIAVGKTDILGLEEKVFEGSSIKVRREAGLPDLDVVMPNREIRAPYDGTNPRHIQFMKHAEEGVINEFDIAIKELGINPDDIKGTLLIRQSNPRGVCSICTQGITNPNKEPGIFMQLTKKYPNLTIKVSSEVKDGVKVSGKQSFILKDGKLIE